MDPYREMYDRYLSTYKFRRVDDYYIFTTFDILITSNDGQPPTKEEMDEIERDYLDEKLRNYSVMGDYPTATIEVELWTDRKFTVKITHSWETDGNDHQGSFKPVDMPPYDGPMGPDMFENLTKQPRAMIGPQDCIRNADRPSPPQASGGGASRGEIGGK